MATKILCVAEKPSIAKAVAGILGGGNFQTVGHMEYDFFSSGLLRALNLCRVIQAISTSRITPSRSILADHGEIARFV